ncbi:MAG: YihY/virulence factor BrkB family protein [Proteobacteria bacterium]|nr:YihY/virulence factor BrkB family protein [Pseudomonadota bacterium]
MLTAARGLLSDASRSYSRHGGRMLASAVAFSALLSIAPLLYIALGAAGFVIDDAAGRASVLQDLGRWIGDDAASTIFTLLERAGEHAQTGLTKVLGVAVLVYASTRLFSQMKGALNQMWNVHGKPGRGFRAKLLTQVRKRGLSLLLVLLVGVLIIAVVAVKTVLSASTHAFGYSGARTMLRAAEMVVSLATTTVMFAALFKWLPDARLAWRDAWRGALVTSVLFSIGTSVISLYLGHKSLTSAYGPGGSLVLLLLWVHYSAQVFFFGAAVTGELAKRRGFPIAPDAYGVRIVIDDGEP